MGGTNCQQWAQNALRDCQKECAGK
jgi:protein subunit release factor B